MFNFINKIYYIKFWALLLIIISILLYFSIFYNKEIIAHKRLVQLEVTSPKEILINSYNVTTSKYWNDTLDFSHLITIISKESQFVDYKTNFDERIKVNYGLLKFLVSLNKSFLSDLTRYNKTDITVIENFNEYVNNNLNNFIDQEKYNRVISQLYSIEIENDNYLEKVRKEKFSIESKLSDSNEKLKDLNRQVEDSLKRYLSQYKNEKFEDPGEPGEKPDYDKYVLEKCVTRFYEDIKIYNQKNNKYNEYKHIQLLIHAKQKEELIFKSYNEILNKFNEDTIDSIWNAHASNRILTKIKTVMRLIRNQNYSLVILNNIIKKDFNNLRYYHLIMQSNNVYYSDKSINNYKNELHFYIDIIESINTDILSRISSIYYDPDNKDIKLYLGKLLKTYVTQWPIIKPNNK